MHEYYHVYIVIISKILGMVDFILLLIHFFYFSVYDETIELNYAWTCLRLDENLAWNEGLMYPEKQTKKNESSTCQLRMLIVNARKCKADNNNNNKLNTCQW